MKKERSVILPAAKLLFSRFGWKKATVEDICRKCRISKKTFYQQFHSKEELFCTLYFGELQYITHELPLLLKTGDSITRLREAIEYMAEYLRDHRYLMQGVNEGCVVMVSAGGMDGCLCRLEKKLCNIIEEIIAYGKEKKCFRDVDEKAVSYAIFVFIQEFAGGEWIDAGVWREKKVHFDVLVGLLLEGLLCRENALVM